MINGCQSGLHFVFLKHTGEDLFANTEFENDIAFHEKQRITINSDDVSESRHKRASLMSGVVQSKVIKLVMFADKGLIDW